MKKRQSDGGRRTIGKTRTPAGSNVDRVAKEIQREIDEQAKYNQNFTADTPFKELPLAAKEAIVDTLQNTLEEEKSKKRFTRSDTHRSSIIRLPIAVNEELKKRAEQAGMYLPQYMQNILIAEATETKQSNLQKVRMIVLALKALSLTDAELEAIFDAVI